MSKVILILMMMLLISTASTSASPIQTSSPFHIFLSFRGNDTRNDYASLLYSALSQAGFDVFMDDESIRAGHHIESVIQKEIERSLGAVIIFSPNFTSSEWCLDELAQIVERKKKLGTGYVLQPIYVKGVRPDDVQELTGSFGEAFSVHDKVYPFWDWKRNNRVKRWRAALGQVGDYRGKVSTDGKWAGFIKEVVKETRREFRKLGVLVNQRPYLTEGTNRLESRYESIQKSAAYLKFMNKISREDVGIFCLSMISFHVLREMIKMLNNFLGTPAGGKEGSGGETVPSPIIRPVARERRRRSKNKPT